MPKYLGEPKMSAPKTDVEKQEKRHKPALNGMKVAVGFAVLLLVAFIVWTVASGDEPETADEQVEVPSGDVVDTDTGETVDQVD